MIDEEEEKKKLETMNKANLQNLLTAISVDQYLEEIFGDAIKTSYSPETGTIVIKYQDPRPSTLRAILASAERATHLKPLLISYSQIDGIRKTQDRIHFPGGFSVMAIKVARWS